jgi:hypothetical protein
MYFFIKIKLQNCVLYYNFIVTSFFIIIRGDQIGLFKLVTLNCILNCITGVTFGC